MQNDSYADGRCWRGPPNQACLLLDPKTPQQVDKACLVQIIEQIMEHVADLSGADPVEVRRLNFLKAYPLAPAPQIHPGQANGRQQVQIPVPFVIRAPAPPSKSLSIKHDDRTCRLLTMTIIMRGLLQLQWWPRGR